MAEDGKSIGVPTFGDYWNEDPKIHQAYNLNPIRLEHIIQFQMAEQKVNCFQQLVNSNCEHMLAAKKKILGWLNGNFTLNVHERLQEQGVNLFWS